MGNITKATLTEYNECVSKMLKIRHQLFEKAKEVFTWENENLRYTHTMTLGSDWVLKDITIEKEVVWFFVYETWAYGGYDEDEFSIETYKLFGDEWKEEALQRFKEKMEDARIAKELEDETRAIELEAKERAELARLQAKYGAK